MIYLFGDYISFVHATKVQKKMHIRKKKRFFLEPRTRNQEPRLKCQLSTINCQLSTVHPAKLLINSLFCWYHVPLVDFSYYFSHCFFGQPHFLSHFCVCHHRWHFSQAFIYFFSDDLVSSNCTL